MTSCRLKPSSISNSLPMVGNAGVTIVDENGEMNVKRETRIVVIHFCLLLQFRGLEGSFGPSQVTCDIQSVVV